MDMLNDADSSYGFMVPKFATLYTLDICGLL